MAKARFRNQVLGRHKPFASEEERIQAELDLEWALQQGGKPASSETVAIVRLMLVLSGNDSEMWRDGPYAQGR